LISIGRSEEPSLISKLENHLADYRDACEHIKNRRNKQLAHCDFDTALALENESLPGPPRQEIERALSPLREFMEAFEAYFTDTTTEYTRFVGTGHDATSLVGVLRAGLRYE
jgi:AbiU2